MTTFNELRSAVHAHDKAAVLSVLRDYTDSLEDIDPLRYIIDNWGYVPASSWDNGVASPEQHRGESAITLVFVNSPMKAFVNLKGRNIEIAHWDDYHPVLSRHVYPLRIPCFEHLKEHAPHLYKPSLLELMTLLESEPPLHSVEDIKRQDLRREHDHLYDTEYGAIVSDTPFGVVERYSKLFKINAFKVLAEVDASVLKEYYALNR